MIDINKIQEGDKVTIEVVVIDKSKAAVLIRMPSKDCFRLWIEPNNIVAHTPAPRPIEVGCYVRFKKNDMILKVIAVFGEYIWVDNEELGHGLPFTTNKELVVRIN